MDTIKKEYIYQTTKPKNPKQFEIYVNPKTNCVWRNYNKTWYNKGNYEKFVEEEKNNPTIGPKKPGRRKVKPTHENIEKPVIVKQENNFSKEPIILADPEPTSNEDKEIRNEIIKEIEKDISKKKPTIDVEPDPNLVQGNKFYFVVDITPSQNDQKISFSFVNYLSRYFVGSTIYLIGDSSKYTLDHFSKKRPNVLFLKPKTNKIVNSYIVYSRRFYTFNIEFAKWAVEHNINGITVFVPKRSNIVISNVDVCELTGDVDLQVISQNMGNVLKYK